MRKENDHLFFRLQGSLGLDVHAHDGDAAGIILLAVQLEDHLRSPPEADR